MIENLSAIILRFLVFFSQDPAASLVRTAAQKLTSMAAPSADASREQKQAWLSFVRSQFYDSYRAQGHGEQSSELMANKSMDQYKMQCVQQGIKLD